MVVFRRFDGTVRRPDRGRAERDQYAAHHHQRERHSADRTQPRQACTRKESTPGDACAEVVVTWVNRDRPTPQNPAGGIPFEVRGTDFVSAVYEDTRWALCHSRWTAFETVSGTARLLDIKK